MATVSMTTAEKLDDGDETAGRGGEEPWAEERSTCTDPTCTDPTCGQLSQTIDERGDYNGGLVSKPRQSSCICGVQAQ